jgi:hypothetical protein
MSNYVKSTNFAAKDALASGNAGKIVKGTEIDTEFNNIATAVATKADTTSPTFTGTLTAVTVTTTGNTSVGGVLAVTGNTTVGGTLAATGNTTLSGTLAVTGASTLTGALNLKGNIVFEGATDDAFETTLTVTDPTADRTITLPNATTTVVGTDVTQTLTNKTIALGSNTVSGTAAQFDTACTDTNFVFDSDFTGTNQSKSTNGYQKLPGGVILQWGIDTTSFSEGQNRTYTFPVAFATACYSVQVTIFGNQSASDDNGPVNVFSKSTTTFQVESMSQASVPGITWFAIGV